MSGITTVRVKTGEYTCSKCLNKSLDKLGLRSQINVLEQQGILHISLEQRSQDYQATKVRANLENKIKAYHKQILPVYTENHAIHSLTEKGFDHIKTYQFDKGHKMIFEKVVGSGINEKMERYTITVLTDENRILIDGGNMPGDLCRRQAYKFQKSMGQFEGFKAHSSPQPQKVKEQTQTRQRIKLGR